MLRQWQVNCNPTETYPTADVLSTVIEKYKNVPLRCSNINHMKVLGKVINVVAGVEFDKIGCVIALKIEMYYCWLRKAWLCSFLWYG